MKTIFLSTPLDNFDKQELFAQKCFKLFQMSERYDRKLIFKTVVWTAVFSFWWAIKRWFIDIQNWTTLFLNAT